MSGAKNLVRHREIHVQKREEVVYENAPLDDNCSLYTLELCP